MSVAANVTSQVTTSATSATNTAKPAIGNTNKQDGNIQQQQQQQQQQQIQAAQFGQVNIFLAHLSRRLIGELIVYQWSGVRPSSVRPSSVVVYNAQRSSSPKLLDRSKPNFMWSLRYLGHMTKMAATPIYGKNPSKIFFSRSGGLIFTKLGM